MRSPFFNIDEKLNSKLISVLCRNQKKIFTMNKIYYSLISFLAILLASCGAKEKTTDVPHDTTIPIVTEAVQSTTSGSALAVSGNVEGFKTVHLGFLVGGKINYIAAEEGQMLSRGQLAATLEPTNYSLAKQSADVQVQQLTDDYNRLKIMHDRTSVSESDFKKISFALDEAYTQQRLQGKNLSDTKIYSPVSGVLLQKLAETGEITGVGNPILVIADISTVKVNAYIPENELHNIQLGQQATVEISALDTSFQGKVTEVGSAADPSSRTFTIKVEVSNPKLLIRPGMVAEIKLSSKESHPAITVSAEAVLHNTNEESYVYVVDQKQKKAFIHKVSTGQLVNNQIEIISGLNSGDVIVTGGQQKLSDGSLVTITK
jgi:RND family efflux transporter MFP subunit